MIEPGNLGGIPARVSALRSRYAERDKKMAEVQAVRRGNFEAIAPDMFNDEWKRPIVANLIDTAARDTAAVLAPLPAFNCSAASGLSDKAKGFADKRTKILRSYISNSEFEVQMLRGADQYNSYGLLLICVNPDFEDKAPRWQVEDAIGAYPVWNAKGRTTELARVFYRDWFSLLADYPWLETQRNNFPASVGANNKVECVKYVSDKRVVMYLPQMGNIPLEDVANPTGECYYVAVQRPGLDDEIRGAYDDVIWVQLARHRIQMLQMEGVEKAVRAPLVVTPDVGDVPLGPDAVIVAQNGVASIGRARLDMPTQGFQAVEQLKQEQQLGSMSPESRMGQMDASVITGRGVQQLQGGWMAQIATGQTVFKYALRLCAKISFKMDEALWGDVEKEIRGNDNGVPYSVKYKPRRDIDGDHTVDITYGFAAGLDPNRALVFLLQADGAGLVSKDYIRRNLPVDINAVEQEKQITVEQSRLAIVQSLSALSQSIPQMAAQGMDVTSIIAQQAQFIKLLQEGKTVEEAALVVMTPKPPPGAETPGDATGESAPGGGGGEGGPEGFNDSGLPAQMKPGLATQGPNGRPDLQQLFAGLSGTGAPNLRAGVARMHPTGV